MPIENAVKNVLKTSTLIQIMIYNQRQGLHFNYRNYTLRAVFSNTFFCIATTNKSAPKITCSTIPQALSVTIFTGIEAEHVLFLLSARLLKITFLVKCFMWIFSGNKIRFSRIRYGKQLLNSK